MKSVYAALSLLSFLAIASTSEATSYTPQIDFRDKTIWSDADHEASLTGTDDGIVLTVHATPDPATLWWDKTDGLGIRLSYEDDEIESEERMQVRFEQGVILSTIYISDLFVEDGYAESGAYRIDGGSWVPFDANTLPGSNRNGERRISFASPIQNALLVEFKAPGKIGGEDHEFALMGFDVQTSQIPEPGTALLLGAGLAIMAVRPRLR